MVPNTLSSSIWSHSTVAGTRAIAAPGASYAVDFSQRVKNAELLPLPRQTALLVRSINIEKT
jgi:hypothetical protein